MKHIKIVLPVFVLTCLGVLVMIQLSRTDPNAPSYVAIGTQPAGPFGSINYVWGEDVPFVDGKVWIFTNLSRSNRHEFLFDLEKRKVLGELVNGGAVFSDRERTKLLCEGRASPETVIKSSLTALLSKISLGRIKINTNRVDAYWILDLRKNSARRVGGLSQWPGTGSRWHPSPGFRYGYNVPNNAEENTSFFLCDLERETFRKIQFSGDLRGWWDDYRILIQKPAGDWVLYDVMTQKVSTLFSREAMSERLHKLGIPDDPATVTTRKTWNGTNYDFNLIAEHGWGLYSNGTFILKLERPGPVLTLLRRNFKFKWSGNFNAEQTYYVYDGESGPIGRGGNGAVFLLDLVSSNTITLVPPDNKGYAIPRFYNGTIVYHRNSELWSTKLDGSGNTRLFPPPDQ